MTADWQLSYASPLAEGLNAFFRGCTPRQAAMKLVEGKSYLRGLAPNIALEVSRSYWEGDQSTFTRICIFHKGRKIPSLSFYGVKLALFIAKLYPEIGEEFLLCQTPQKRNLNLIDDTHENLVVSEIPILGAFTLTQAINWWGVKTSAIKAIAYDCGAFYAKLMNNASVVLANLNSETLLRLSRASDKYIYSFCRKNGIENVSDFSNSWDYDNHINDTDVFRASCGLMLLSQKDPNISSVGGLRKPFFKQAKETIDVSCLKGLKFE